MPDKSSPRGTPDRRRSERRKSQGSKAATDSRTSEKDVEERPGSRVDGQEEGNKNDSAPSPTPDPKGGNL